MARSKDQGLPTKREDNNE